MNPPKMPIHIGDYMRDTGHLSTLEHGAYLLLLFHYWSTGKLPTDDRKLATIAGMSTAEWRKARPTIAEFFDEEWRHGRVEYELEKAKRISEAGREAGKASGRSRTAKRKTNDRSTADEPTIEPLNRSSEAYASAPGALEPEFEMEPVGEDPKTKLFRKGKTILVSLGISEKRSGSVIGSWLKQKNDPAGVLAALEYAVDHNVVEPVGYVTRLLSQKGQANGTARGADLAFQLAEEARELERAAGVGRPADA